MGDLEAASLDHRLEDPAEGGVLVADVLLELGAAPFRLDAVAWLSSSMSQPGVELGTIGRMLLTTAPQILEQVDDHLVLKDFPKTA